MTQFDQIVKADVQLALERLSKPTNDEDSSSVDLIYKLSAEHAVAIPLLVDALASPASGVREAAAISLANNFGDLIRVEEERFVDPPFSPSFFPQRPSVAFVTDFMVTTVEV